MIRNPKSFSATEAEDEAAGGAGERREGAGGGEGGAGGGQGCRLPVNRQPPSARLRDSGLEVGRKIIHQCGIYIVFIKSWISQGVSSSPPGRADHGRRVRHEAHRGGGQRGGGGGGRDIKQFWFPW